MTVEKSSEMTYLQSWNLCLRSCITGQAHVTESYPFRFKFWVRVAVKAVLKFSGMGSGIASFRQRSSVRSSVTTKGGIICHARAEATGYCRFRYAITCTFTWRRRGSRLLTAFAVDATGLKDDYSLNRALPPYYNPRLQCRCV
jgi:hypothetical protein